MDHRNIFYHTNNVFFLHDIKKTNKKFMSLWVNFRICDDTIIEELDTQHMVLSTWLGSPWNTSTLNPASGSTCQPSFLITENWDFCTSWFFFLKGLFTDFDQEDGLPQAFFSFLDPRDRYGRFYGVTNRSNRPVLATGWSFWTDPLQHNIDRSGNTINDGILLVSM